MERRIAAQPERYLRLYERKFGKHVSSDNAAELFAEYSSSKRHRTLNRRAVHRAAQLVADSVYRRALKEPVGAGSRVVFTGGGTGSGKTTALAWLKLADVEIIYDTTLNYFPSAVERIDEALATGRVVTVVYVFATAEAAFERALLRAMDMGRTVPVDYQAMTHRESPKTALLLADHYNERTGIDFRIVDNTGTFPRMGSRDQLLELDYTGIEERLNGVLEKYYATNRLSELVYRQTKGSGTGSLR